MALGLGHINTHRNQAKVSHFRRAMHFDGSNDFEQAADDNATTFGDESNDSDFTIVTWFKLDSISGENPILLKLNEYEITASDQKLRIFLYDDDTSNYRYWETGNVLAANKWYCAIFVANGDGSGGIGDGEMAIHLNGVKYTTGLGTLSANDEGTYVAMHNKGNHRIGGDAAGDDLDGLVAMVGIFSVAFGDKASARIFNNGVPTNIQARHGITSAQIKAYWTMGNNAADTSEFSGTADTVAAVVDLSATGINMAQTNAAKQPSLTHPANVRADLK